MPLKEGADLLARYLRPQTRMALVVAALLLTDISLDLINPQILRYFIDEAVRGSAVGRLITAAAFFTGITLVGQVVNIAATYTSGRVAWRATNALRADLARHCLSLDMSFHNNRTPGEMIERVDGDASRLGGFFSTFIIEILGNVLLLTGILGLLFREDWRAGLALAVFAAIAILAISRLKHVSWEQWRASLKAETNYYGFLEERLSGREDTRTSAAASYVIRRFHEHQRSWFRTRTMSWLVNNIIGNTTFFMFALGNAAALGVGAYLFREGHITIGAVYLIFHYTNLLLRPIGGLSDSLSTLQRAAANIDRVVGLFETKKTVLDGAGAKFSRDELAVKFENVSFSYNKGEPVLKGVSLELQPGRTLGLLGRTGAGKTTMTRLLFRLYDPDEGRVLVGGRDIRERTVYDLREHIAMVTQDIRLFHGTIRDNLTLFDRTVTDDRLLEIFEDLGLMRWYERLPGGLDTELRSDGGGLSAGEAQLLAFTRVFLRDPSVLILDEATSRLDRSTEQLIENAVGRLVQGRTVIIIAHHLATVERCDDIVILEGGRVTEHGDRKQLAADLGSRFHQLLQTGLEGVLS